MDPFKAGEALMVRAAAWERPLLVMAHHDDEVLLGGLLQRVAPRVRIVWVTNSDGLYYEGTLKPAEYAEVRKAEGVRSAAIAGVPESATRCLDASEVEIYRRMAALYAGKSRVEDVLPHFRAIRDQVVAAVREARPDAVFTMAWQGGQPEHDLTHFFTRLAVCELERQTGRAVEFFHVPAYEYTILVAMRFNPLYRGERIRILLTPDELATKLEMIRAYPSQVRLFGDFRKVFRWVGRPLFALTGGPATLEDFLAVEELGPVPEIDYAAKPHVHDRLTYMFDDFEGTRVTYSRSILPLVKALAWRDAAGCP
ncbi:MAG: PIG-L family deacetylase [Deltaproteobacteria bacterium]|nr:PIG-L family deacetylase [Deltaproteobacteria bacterium]